MKNNYYIMCDFDKKLYDDNNLNDNKLILVQEQSVFVVEKFKLTDTVIQ